MKTLTPKEITQDIWETYTSMQNGELIHIYKQKENEYSYLTLNGVDPNGEELTEKQAKSLILQSVKESLEQLGTVYLYYCPDNQEIALELISPEENLEDTFYLIGTNYYTAKD